MCNHQSWLDGPLIAAVLPFPVVLVVAPEEYQGARKWVLSLVPHVVMEQAEALSVKRLARLIERGVPVLVFPEGRVTRTGSLMKLYDTAGLAALKTGAAILPLSIDGLATSGFGEIPGRHEKIRRPDVSLTACRIEPAMAPLEGSLRARRRRVALYMLSLLQAASAAAVPRQTLFEAFLMAARRFGRKRAILEEGRQAPKTYGDLVRASLALGRLTARLTREGEAVGVLMPNAAATVALLFGLAAMGRVPAMLNFTAGWAGVQAACQSARLRTVVTSRRFIEALAEQGIRLKLETVEVVYLEDLKEGLTLLDKVWLLWAQWTPERVIARQDPAAAAAILFTSGSEGSAKGVVLSHAAILSNIAQMRAVIGFTPADKFLNALPMYHSYSLTACTLMPLVTGTKVLLYPTPLHYHVIPELTYSKHCTFLFGTSTFLGHYARHAHPYDFHGLRVVVSGAEKLDDDVAALWLRKFGLRITEGYGATECSPVLALNAPLAYRAGSVGRLLPGIEHRILPVHGIGNGGELHVRGPNIMLGYLFPEHPGVLHPPRSELGDGWYATGDVVEMDDEGFLSVRGRVKRFAKVAGEMISLEVVERIARYASPQHQHAASVQVIADLGESTVLFTTDPVLTRGVLHQSARKLGTHELAVARSIVHVKDLPRLGTGKTDYVALQQLIADGLKQYLPEKSDSGTVVTLRMAPPLS